LVAALITVGRWFDTRNLASTNIGLSCLGFPYMVGFPFRGESPTPPAENEGKHYL